MIINMLKEYYLFCLIAISSLISFAHQETPTIHMTFSSPHHQPSDHIRHGIRTKHNIPSPYKPSSCYADYNKTYYASLAPVDFQNVFKDTPNMCEILNNYPLYAFPSFLEFARTLPYYETYILELYDKIQHDKTFKKQTAYMPYFEYSFGWGYKNSGFHEFVKSETQRIINAQQHEQATIEAKNTLFVTDSQSLYTLTNHYTQKLYDMPPGNNSERLTERINAINQTRSNNGKCFDYSSHVAHLNFDGPNVDVFQNRYGTHIDCQLHKELCQTSNAMRHLERTYSNNPHVQILAPVVYQYIKHAKNERCPLTAFELSDVCHTITQILSNGMHILYDASSAIGKGAWKSVNEFTSVEHWKNMVTGAAQLGLLFVDALGQEDALHYAMVVSATSNNSNAFEQATEKYCTLAQSQKNAINLCAQETYKKIKAMSWQEVLENGTEIGTTMILDMLALNAVNSCSRTASNLLKKQLSSAMESGALFTEQYAVEVAGFGKLIIEEGAGVSTKAADLIKNDLTLFTHNNKNISHIASDLGKIAHNIHKSFEHLIKSANTIIKGNNTAAGRAFQKHATREGSAFVGEITGNAVKNTEQAMNYINMIIKSPESSFIIRNTKSYGEVLDIRLLNGVGARWTSDGKTFIGFLEKYTI